MAAGLTRGDECAETSLARGCEKEQTGNVAPPVLVTALLLEAGDSDQAAFAITAFEGRPNRLNRFVRIRLT